MRRRVGRRAWDAEGLRWSATHRQASTDRSRVNEAAAALRIRTGDRARSRSGRVLGRRAERGRVGRELARCGQRWLGQLLVRLLRIEAGEMRRCRGAIVDEGRVGPSRQADGVARRQIERLGLARARVRARSGQVERDAGVRATELSDGLSGGRVLQQHRQQRDLVWAGQRPQHAMSTHTLAASQSRMPSRQGRCERGTRRRGRCRGRRAPHSSRSPRRRSA